MENLLFDSYIVFLKQNKKKSIKIPWYIWFLAMAGICSTLVVMVATITGRTGDHLLIPFAIEVCSCSLLLFCSEAVRAKTLIARRKEHVAFCKRVYAWLSCEGIDVSSPESIKELKKRIDARIAQFEQNKDRRVGLIKYLLSVVVAPLFMAGFSQLISKTTHLWSIIAVTFVILFGIAGIAGAVYIVYCCYRVYPAWKEGKLKHFSETLQGVLDTQFDEGLFAQPKRKKK